MKCMSQFIWIMSLKMRWDQIWATFGIQTNEAIRVQKSLEGEVAALQQIMLSMRNQSQINSSSISWYQEGALVVGKSLVEKERKDLQHYSYHGSLCSQGSTQDAKVVLSAEDVSSYHVICFAIDNIFNWWSSKVIKYISQFRIPSIALSLLTAPVLESVVLMKTGLQMVPSCFTC